MENDGFAPILLTTDWNEEWKRLQVARKRADSAQYWNERAATFHRKDSPNSYVEGFLGNIGLEPGDSVFDMGCGNGALTLPLAAAGHRVIAADFSQGMLDILVEDARDRGVLGLVKPICMSWSDDWESFGVVEGCVDIAVASRSIATDDLGDALMRLDRVARKRAAVTLSTSMSPRIDERILVDLGLQPALGRDYLYAFNILASRHIHPSVVYLDNDRKDRYPTREDAMASLGRMRGDILDKIDPGEREATGRRFDEWVGDNLVEDRDDAGAFWRLRRPRLTRWALISWETAR